MASVQDEVEAKYDVGEDVALPPVTEVFAGARGGRGPWSGSVTEERLDAVYVDTDALDLAGARLTLRRRTGGHDAGWHLKVPAGEHRREVRLPLDASGAQDDAPVPDELVALTWAVTLGRPLAPVARIETRRTLHRLLDPTGAVLAEVADDRVEARRVLPTEGTGRALGAVQSWREVEVELVDGPPELLAAADQALRALGLAPAAGPSKLGRALGLDPARAGGAPGADDARGGGPVRTHLREQVGVLRAHDLPVRLDAPDAVHAMRVAARRVRSALRTFGPVLAPAGGDADAGLTDDMRRLGHVLGAARDAEVLRDRARAALEAEPGDAALDAAAADEVVARLDGAYRDAHAAVVEALDQPWYRSLLTTLAALAAADGAGPGVTTGDAADAADEVPDDAPGLVALVAGADAEVRRAARRAARAAEEADTDRLVRRRHALRKAARRARYAAEAVTPAVGDDAAGYAAAMEALQDTLGEHLDGLAARERVRGLAQTSDRPATAFTLGRLHALEEARAARTWEAAATALAAARRKDVRRWLRG